MQITINVNLDNAAFEDNPNELQEILARQIPHNLKPGDDGTLKDSNGNRVGSYEVNESF
jgi:hypothetical protein